MSRTRLTNVRRKQNGLLHRFFKRLLLLLLILLLFILFLRGIFLYGRHTAYSELGATRLDSLQTRLEQLEQEARELDKKNRALGKLARVQSYPPPADSGGKDFAQRLDKTTAALNVQDAALTGIRHKLNQQYGKPRRLPSGWPVREGYVSSLFGARDGKHEGVDIVARRGSEIAAFDGGVVSRSEKRGAYGYFIEITHPTGYSSRYAHNSKNLVKRGDKVRKGQTIALVGSSGNASTAHVHFEIRRGGTAVEPLDYLP